MKHSYPIKLVAVIDRDKMATGELLVYNGDSKNDQEKFDEQLEYADLNHFLESTMETLVLGISFKHNILPPVKYKCVNMVATFEIMD